MGNKVFISYAKEDIIYAERLFEFLSTNKYDVWLDKKKMLPGSNWEFKIQKALKEADFIIILLSSTSVNKRGYVQKEFKQALRYAEEKREGDIFIIPVLIDECTVPYGLDKFQWIHYAAHDSFKAILASLNSQIELITPTAKRQNTSYINQEVEVNFPFENNIGTKISIPVFSNNPLFDAESINSSIKAEAFSVISEFQNFMIDDNHYTNMPDSRKPMVSLIIDYLINYQSDFSMSIALNIEEEFAGPHPVSRIETKNYLFHPTRIISLRDLIEIDNFVDFVEDAVSRYHTNEEAWALDMVNADIKRGLESYYINESKLDFLFDAEGLTLILSNFLPRVIQYGSNIRIPINDLKFKAKF